VAPAPAGAARRENQLTIAASVAVGASYSWAVPSEGYGRELVWTTRAMAAYMVGESWAEEGPRAEMSMVSPEFQESPSRDTWA